MNERVQPLLRSLATASEPAPAREKKEPGVDGAGTVYLDLLRAGAANWVVLAHLLAMFQVKWMAYQSGGVAVVVFFLLSGFLISQSIMKRRHLAGPRFPGFLADRVARIMTPYVPALVLVSIADALFLTTHFGGNGLSKGFVAFIGNLFMLEDYPLFQVLEVAGSGFPWRIRPYNSAEPFWTVAIEMWIYVAVGLIFFTVFTREKLRPIAFWLLLGMSLPVLVWNAAAGGGRSLSLTWLVGALAGIAVPGLSKLPDFALRRWFSLFLFVTSLAAVTVHSSKFGFDPYELQTAVLLSLLMFSPFIYLQTLGGAVPAWIRRLGSGLASYSYSLYLIHNTCIALVWSATGGNFSPSVFWTCIAAAHVAGLLLYFGFERHHRQVARWLRPRFEAGLGNGSRPATTTTLQHRPIKPG